MNYIIIGNIILLLILILILAILLEHRFELMEANEKIKILELENAMNKYSYQSLVREIDFHLHNQSDEIAKSYFANCLELRKAKGTSYSDYFEIWKSQ